MFQYIKSIPITTNKIPTTTIFLLLLFFITFYLFLFLIYIYVIYYLLNCNILPILCQEKYYIKIKDKYKNKIKYKKQKQKIAKIHQKIANQRKDFLHKTSHQIANEVDGVCIEDLNMQAMSKSMNFGKSVHDNGFGMFLTFLSYKLDRKGKKLIKIDKFYPSSKTCSCCGYIHKELQKKYFQC